MKNDPEVICGALCIVGESPLWDAGRNALWYIDIHGQRLRRLDYASGRSSDTVLPQQPGALVQADDGSLIGCMSDGIYRFSEKMEMESLFAPLKLAGPRFNDAKAGPDGAIYGGTIHYGRKGAFYRVDGNGTVRVLLTGIGNSNGLDWDISEAGHEKLYYIDSPTRKITRFDFDPENGEIHHPETVRKFSPSEGGPDGMTMDSEGMLYAALWGGGVVLRIDPETGKTVSEFRLPVSQPSSCCFAGDDLRDLIVTTAAHNIDLRREPLAGAVFRFRTDVPGRPLFRFKVKEKSR